MSYTKVGPFTNDSATPPVDKSFLDALETFLATRTVDGNDASTNFVPVWNGLAWVYQKVAASQLNLANGDIAIAKVADPGTGKVIGSSGGIATAVNPPGFEIGYDQITASVTVSSTTEATGTTVITCAAHTFDGSPVMVEFFSPAVLPAGSTNAEVNISLFEGSTQIGRFLQVNNPASGLAYGAQLGRLRFTPSAASHTYTVTAFQSVGNGTIVAGPGGTGAFVPAFVRFTKV